MSPLFQCAACGGSYREKQDDGSLSFHVCPMLPPDQHGLERFRDGHRDENVQLGPDGTAGGIKAAGSGVQCIARPGIKEPAWITQMNKRLRKDEGI